MFLIDDRWCVTSAVLVHFIHFLILNLILSVDLRPGFMVFDLVQGKRYLIADEIVVKVNVTNSL